MKAQKSYSALILILFFYPFLIIGCSKNTILDMPEILPPIVKDYRHITLYGKRPGMVNTEIFLEKGDLYSILATGIVYTRPDRQTSPSKRLYAMIGKSYYFPALSPGVHTGISASDYSGNLYLGILDGGFTAKGSALKPDWYEDNSGSFRVDIIVWEKEDYVQISDFLEKMKIEDPQNETLSEALDAANRFKTIQLATQRTTKDLEETREELQELKDKAIGSGMDKKIAQLEKKLSNLMNTLIQLDKLKKQLRAEQIRANLLNEKLAKVMEEKESLREKLESGADIERELREEKKRAELLSEKLTKVTKEKKFLEKKLESEADIKKELETALTKLELGSKKQEILAASLYEKERQLKSKLQQLDISQQQSEEYQTELKRLDIRVQSLNAELKQAKSKTVTASVKEELDKTLQEKSKLEADVKISSQKESKLHEEISNLQTIAEKTRLEAENSKKELAALRNREKLLVTQIEELRERLDRGTAPVLVISKPKNGARIKVPTTMLYVIAVDDKGVSKLTVALNNKPVELKSGRGLKLASPDKKNKKIDISERLQLAYGPNTIKVTVMDTNGISTQEEITIFREKAYGDVWAVIIGINQYPNVRKLKYAVNDALGFKKYLKEYVGIADDHIFFLIDQEATKVRIENQLGTQLKRKAAKGDTVIIFYAGHGAVETDPSNPDGDGFEKYLLPYDADLDDLYTTAISMDDVGKIFQRIRAERLIFIADTCYSGASGGRTMMATKTRANLSDRFYERISKGKGRVIISSSSANEISKEDDSLQHGIFSYYLLEGLKGQADQDSDGIITVSELFSYISRKVPEASAQDQHPVKKGETEGELVIGRVK